MDNELNTRIPYQKLCKAANNASSLQTTVRHDASEADSGNKSAARFESGSCLQHQSRFRTKSKKELREAREDGRQGPQSSVFLTFLHPFGTSLFLPMRRGYHDAAAKEFWSQNTKSLDHFSNGLSRLLSV